LSVNAIRYVILEDLHRRFAVRARQRKAKREAKRLERKEARLRAEERRRRYLETIDRIQHLKGGQGGEGSERAISPDTTRITHSLTHIPHRFTLHSGTHRRIPTFFSRSSNDTNSKKKNMGSDSTLQNDMELAGDSVNKPETANMEEHAESTDSPTTQSPRGPERGPTFNSSSENDCLTDTHTPNIHDNDLVRFMTMDDRYPPLKTRKSFLRRLWPFKRSTPETSSEVLHSPAKQRELERQIAHKESMEEYGRRLRFSASMFLVFWLGGAVIFMLTESWTFFESLYFCGISFSTIGYGDYVPRTPTGRSIFIAYCLVGVVTLTSLASLMSEVLGKSMRRHVVETQLRTAERLEALAESRRAEGNPDIEQDPAGHSTEQEESEFQRQMQPLNNLVHSNSNENNPNNSCHGSLQQVIDVSRELDNLLQKVLGLDACPAAGSINSAPSKKKLPVEVIAKDATKSILEFINKSDVDDLDEPDPTFLSPSLSRDINSTGFIQQLQPHRALALRHKRQLSLDYRGMGGSGVSSQTFHGVGYSSSSDSSQLKITAWPKSSSASTRTTTKPAASGRFSNTGSASPPPPSSSSSPSPSPSVVSSVMDSPSESITQQHRHLKNGTVTLSAVQWQHLIEYSKQFKVLVETCEAAVQKVSAWEAKEKQLRLKRRQTRLIQLQVLNERRRRHNELDDMHRPLEDEFQDEEEELEALEAWDEEGSEDEEADEAHDRHRAKISAALLGGVARRSSSSSPRRQSKSQSRQGGSGRTSTRSSPSRGGHRPSGLDILLPSTLTTTTGRLKHTSSSPLASTAHHDSDEQITRAPDMSPYPRGRSSGDYSRE
ncbi:hypothetical protein BG004_003331, partial [Podila humilis]